MEWRSRVEHPHTKQPEGPVNHETASTSQDAIEMDIEFDEAKRSATLEERGLDFARAGEVFADVHSDQQDDRFEYGELRTLTMGFLDGHLVMVVWTPRGSARRIISMRKCNDREQRKFEKLVLDRPG